MIPHKESFVHTNCQLKLRLAKLAKNKKTLSYYNFKLAKICPPHQTLQINLATVGKIIKHILQNIILPDFSLVNKQTTKPMHNSNCLCFLSPLYLFHVSNSEVIHPPPTLPPSHITFTSFYSHAPLLSLCVIGATKDK